MPLLLLLLTLTGCGTYKKYERPDLGKALADSLYRPEARPDTTASLADMKWQELFTDTCLQALIVEGLRNNTDLRTARLKVEEAQAALRASKLAYLPSLQLAPEGSLSSYDGSKTMKTYTLGASASWEVDLFGRLTTAKRKARAALLESDAYRQAVQTQVVATVADSYYALLMLDEQIRITDQTAESWREYVRSLHALMLAGQADRATVAQAEASRLSTEASLNALQQQLIEQENALCVFLGRIPGRIARTSLDVQVFPDRLAVGLPLDLLARRPDVRRAETVLMQAFYGTASARAAFYPNITLGGSAGWTNSGGAVVTNPGSWLLTAIGSLVQPLFSRGQNLANLRIAKAQQQEALFAFRQSVLDAGNEVNNALSQCQNARERVLLDSEQVDYLSIAAGDTRLLMENSSTTNYLQVLTARQSLLQAHLTLAQDRYEEIQGIISLYHALGGGTD